jgi:hypothetical protein
VLRKAAIRLYLLYFLVIQGPNPRKGMWQMWQAKFKK